MAITIEQVQPTKTELKRFIKFPFDLYKGNDCYVPPIVDFELSTLLSSKNPAFEHCQASYWIALKDGKIVGRIAGIIHNDELKEESKARFGWVDFIDDYDVSEKLFNQAQSWASEKGATEIHGPLGFTDLDFEGSLISGFDKMATQATIYNYPYYADHYHALGFEKAVDWVEVRGKVPPEKSRKLERTASIVSSRFGLQAKKFKNAKSILPYARGAFQVLNKAYNHLYGYHPLSERQIQYYIDQYFGFVRKEFVSIIVNREDEVIALAISFPSLSKAFQKAKGNMFPFGFIHLLKAFKSNDHVDMFLIGVDPEYQKLGANALIFHEMIKTYQEKGVKYVSTGPMLEENRSVLNLWNDYSDYMEPITIKRRCYKKSI